MTRSWITVETSRPRRPTRIQFVSLEIATVPIMIGDEDYMSWPVRLARLARLA